MTKSKSWTRDPYTTTNKYPIVSAYSVKDASGNINLAIKYRVPAAKAGEYSKEPTIWYPMDFALDTFGDLLIVRGVDNQPRLTIAGLPIIDDKFIQSCMVELSYTSHTTLSLHAPD